MAAQLKVMDLEGTEETVIFDAPVSYKSKVWQSFGFTKGRKNVVCKLCKLKTAYSGNTTNMTTHLRRHHAVGQPEHGASKIESNSNVKPLTKSDGHTEVKCQPTIAHTFQLFKKGNMSLDRKREITMAIAEYVLQDLRPFRMVESSKFKCLINLLEPKYTIPSHQHFSEIILPEIYDRVKVKVVDDLEKATDGWTSRVTESYVTITAQFINEKWEMTSYVLQTRLLEESHAGVNIANCLLDAISEWGIQSKKPALVSDNASNMVVAARESQLTPFVRCFAHTLNLCAQKGLKVAAVSNLLAKIRRIVVYFHKSSQAASSLKEKQKVLGLPQHKLKIDVCTRWNSAFDMVNRYLEQQAAVYAALAATKHLRKRADVDVATLNDSGIQNAECVLITMGQLKKATQALCTEAGPTLSLVCPLLHTLLDNLTVKANDKGLIKNDRKIYIGDIDLLRVASFLDPRVKELPFLSEDQRDDIMSHIKAMTMEEAPTLQKIQKIKQEPQEQVHADLPSLPTMGMPSEIDETPSGPISETHYQHHPTTASPPQKKALLNDLLGDVFITKADLKPISTTEQMIDLEIKKLCQRKFYQFER